MKVKRRQRAQCSVAAVREYFEMTLRPVERARRRAAEEARQKDHETGVL